MSDMSSMNRENKKKQLRQQIVTPHPTATGKGPSHRRDEDSEEIIRKAQHKIRKRRRVIILIILMILTMVGFASYHYYMNYQFTEYDIVWETEIKESSFAKYESFGSNVLKYTKDGASYIDSQGKSVWVESYEMKSPIASVNGDYVIIADQQGTGIYICDKKGRQGVVTTLRPILKATVSSHGVVAVIMEDASANYIQYYNKDGTILKIDMKGTLQGNVKTPVGYPLDICLSPNGQQLIGSYVYYSGTLKGRVAFHDFSEIGKNDTSRLVAGFDGDFASNIVPRVKFLSDIYSCAFADNGLAFFSSNNQASPELIKKIPVDDEIQSIFYSDKYVGVIVNHTQSGNPYRMDVYKINGDKVFSKEFDYQYQEADIDGDSVFLYNEDSCKVYNMSGAERFSAEFDWTLSKVTAGRFPNTLILTGPQVMKEIKFK